ncbi:MAG: LptF/LptG family permease [Candidatus Omnitrophica bacterium]|nr:LptF/LptG family permease [Candidatus Omnitrophota bacterium]
MKILDRYIIRELVVPIIFCSISLIMLFLIADIFDNLSDMLKNKTSLKYILQYYLNLVPLGFTQTIPWATLLGTVYLLTQLNRNNELLAMKANGLSIESIMVPILFVGLVLGITTFVVNDRIVPATYLAAKNILESQIERNISKKQGLILYDVTYFSPDNELFYIQSFEAKNNLAKNMNVVFFSPEKKMERKLSAKEAEYRDGIWKLKRVTAYEMSAQGRIVGEPLYLAERDFNEVRVTPKDLIEASRESVFLSYKELKNQIEKLKKHQLHLHAEEVELHNKLASPWQNLIMILIAVPLLSVVAKRKQFAMNILICLGVVLTFHITTAVAQALGKSGTLLPPLAAWLAILVFATITVLKLDLGNK